MKRRDFLTYAVVTPLLVACRPDLSDPTSQAPGATSAESTHPASALASAGNAVFSSGGSHALSWDKTGSWYMDGAPFQFFGGEIHPARVPPEYWEHRIKMVKALGCNTISLYTMWNFHELSDGSFNFSDPGKDIGHFIDLCAKNNMWVLLRPGPYVCAEWDFGGLPPRMLADPQYRNSAGQLQIRGNFANYMAAVKAWNAALYNKVIRGRTIDAGGPIMLVAVENEYTSWSPDDPAYPAAIAQQWRNLGYAGKLCICDGYANGFKDHGITMPADTAYGMTANGDTASNYPIAANNYGTGVFGAECYPGWLALWGDPAQTVNVGNFAQQISSLASKKLSFVLYVGHGGTNFGFASGCEGYNPCQPVATTYDYGAPVSESGDANLNFGPIQSAFITSASYNVPFFPAPAGIPHINDQEIPPVPASQFQHGALISRLPLNLQNEQPKTIEWMAWTLNKSLPVDSSVYPAGVAVYQTTLPAAGGDISLTFDRPPDCALVFVNQVKVPNVLLSTVKNGSKTPMTTCNLGKVPANATLQIVCLPFGRASVSTNMNNEGRGLSGNVYANGVALKRWKMALSNLSSNQLANCPFGNALPAGGQPFLSKAAIHISTPKDMYIDMSGWGMGYLFVNGINLGRYWPSAGPQTRLYCPGVWLNCGSNSIVVFEFMQNAPGSISFHGSSNLPVKVNAPITTTGVPLVANMTYQIQNANSGLYLDAVASGAGNQAAAQKAFSAAKSQCWTLTPGANGSFVIKNAGTGGVLDVANHGATPGSTVIVFPANGGSNQSWKAANIQSNLFTLTGLQSQLLLDVSGASKQPTSGSAASIVVAAPAKADSGWPFSQQWRIIPAILDNATYTIRSALSDLLLGAYQGGSSNGTLLGIDRPTGGKEQQWLLTFTAAGHWQLKNVKSGLVMDVKGQQTANGTALELWSANGGANQQFTLIPQADGLSFAIQGVQSGRVLDDNNSGTSPTVYGAAPTSAITLWDGNGGVNQRWIFTQVS